jgi:hypothetical protein
MLGGNEMKRYLIKATDHVDKEWRFVVEAENEFQLRERVERFCTFYNNLYGEDSYELHSWADLDDIDEKIIKSFDFIDEETYAGLKGGK